MTKLFDTGELALLEAAERTEKNGASAARQALASRGRDFVADHPVAALGAAAGVTATVALVARSPLGTKALRVPGRLAVSAFLGALSQV